jgi:hypothetical protein
VKTIALLTVLNLKVILRRLVCDVGLKGPLQFFYFVVSNRESRDLGTSGINPRTIKSFVFV